MKLLLAEIILLSIPQLIVASPFAGNWCLTSPDGGAVWMSVEVANNQPSVKMLWEIGGVEPAVKALFVENFLQIERAADHWYMTREGVKRDIIGTDLLYATLTDNTMRIKVKRTLNDGTVQPEKSMIGRRQTPLPNRPDLSTVKFGEPETLFNGRNLDGWCLTRSGDNNAWSARDNMLCNDPQLESGVNARQFGNIRTEQTFEDFRLTLEVRLPKGGNSGIYLRGRYEVQVADSFGRKPSWGGIGGVYSRIVPLENAAKPAGEWQQFDILLVDRHVTVRLNQRLVIDNQPVAGCTGGALDSDDLAPGPLYFQGDHTAVEYRNITLYPRKQ